MTFQNAKNPEKNYTLASFYYSEVSFDRTLKKAIHCRYFITQKSRLMET